MASKHGLTNIQTVDWLAARAHQGGGVRVTAARTVWDIASRCEAPVHRELHGRSESEDGTGYVTVAPGNGARTNIVALTVRCRRCAACLRYRASIWRTRATAEINGAARTWMGTLTLSPSSHHLMMSRARRRWIDRGNGDLDKEPPEVIFAERHREIGKEITKFVKRVREKHKGVIRFLLVVEAHKSGLPHYHMLAHQCDAEALRYDDLQAQWTWGFSKWKLCDKLAASYVCKYLTKSSQARVRASLGYGGLSNEVAPLYALFAQPRVPGRDNIDTRKGEDEKSSHPFGDTLSDVRK